jgi:hypothetical protein
MPENFSKDPPPNLHTAYRMQEREFERLVTRRTTSSPGNRASFLCWAEFDFSLIPSGWGYPNRSAYFRDLPQFGHLVMEYSGWIP